MFGGLIRLLAAAVVAGAVLVVPPAALADGCGGGPSAVHVYTPCLPSGGGGKPASHTSGTHTSGGSTSSTYVVPLSKRTARKLKKAGNDGRSLSYLVRGYGAARFLQSSSSGTASEPTAMGSAFDLGSGPTTILIVLAGTAVLLLAASGFRYARHRR